MLFTGLKPFLSSLFKLAQADVALQPHLTTSMDFYQDSFTDPIYKQDDVRIPYYPKLTHDLEMQHHQLLNTFADIGNALCLKEFDTIRDQLIQFKEEFKAHLETKNIKCYGYLEQNLKGQRAEFNELRCFRKDMRKIERHVLKFLEQWIDFDVTRRSAAEFKMAYEITSNMLLKRIEDEEQLLHPLYNRT